MSHISLTDTDRQGSERLLCRRGNISRGCLPWYSFVSSQLPLVHCWQPKLHTIEKDHKVCCKLTTRICAFGQTAATHGAARKVGLLEAQTDILIICRNFRIHIDRGL